MEKRKIIIYLLVICGGILGGFILAAISGSSVLRLDNWYSTWNDEVGYFRTIEVMHSYGLSQGVAGYNEQITNLPAFGAYNYLTYLPHYVFSFITGTTSHNCIVYSNILMMTIAYLLYLVLVRPSFQQGVFLFVFQMTQLIIARYTWSGMTETTTLSFSIIMMAIVLFLHRRTIYDNPKRIHFIILGGSIINIGFCGIIRPFLWCFIVFPSYLIIRWYKRKQIDRLACSVGLGFGLIIMVLSVWTYLWMNKNVCAPYFSTSESTTQVMNMFKSVNMGEIIQLVVKKNISGTRAWMNGIKELKWRGIIMTEILFVVISLVLLVCTQKKKADDESARMNKHIWLLYLLCIFLVYQANIIMYSANELHRMMLGVLMGGVLLLIDAISAKEVPGRFNPALLYLIVNSILFTTSIFANGTNEYALPHYDSSSDVDYDCSKLKDDLEKAMPYATGDRWDNTVAGLPVFEGFQLFYCRPTYVAGNACTREYLIEAVENKTLRSKYVFVSDTDDELYGRLEKWGEVVWNDYGHTIFCRQ